MKTYKEYTKEEYAELLYTLYYELHPVYSNTAGRTGGIGGQAFTQVCLVGEIPATKKELADMTAVEDGLRAWNRRDDNG